jgi:large subunit ribosomal protein L21
MANFAVIKTGGKQYLVKEGDTVKVEKLEAKEGDVITFEPLLVSDEAGNDVKVGTPSVSGASVAARVLGEGRDKKVVVVKYHAKTRYRRKAGHRQPFTELKIESVK